MNIEHILQELYVASNREDLVNNLINRASGEGTLDTNQVSDGYHTFGELYDHRNLLWVLACGLAQRQWKVERAMRAQRKGNEGEAMPEYLIWKTHAHADGTPCPDGWFVLGWGHDPRLMITYHVPERYWDHCAFAQILEQVPAFDGHTSQDVLTRITNVLMDL